MVNWLANWPVNSYGASKYSCDLMGCLFATTHRVELFRGRHVAQSDWITSTGNKRMQKSGKSFFAPDRKKKHGEFRWKIPRGSWPNWKTSLFRDMYRTPAQDTWAAHFRDEARTFASHGRVHKFFVVSPKNGHLESLWRILWFWRKCWKNVWLSTISTTTSPFKSQPFHIHFTKLRGAFRTSSATIRCLAISVGDIEIIVSSFGWNSGVEGALFKHIPGWWLGHPSEKY